MRTTSRLANRPAIAGDQDASHDATCDATCDRTCDQAREQSPSLARDATCDQARDPTCDSVRQACVPCSLPDHAASRARTTHHVLALVSGIVPSSGTRHESSYFFAACRGVRIDRRTRPLLLGRQPRREPLRERHFRGICRALGRKRRRNA